MSTIPEQRLWQHVLLAILNDLRSPGTRDYRNQEFARRWVGPYPSKDFQMVCEMAGFEISSTHRYFRRISEKGGSSTAPGSDRDVREKPQRQRGMRITADR